MSQAQPAPAPQPTVRPLVSMSRISKNFGAVRALTGVDLEVYPGEVVALVGDNGAGKSTLVKILAGVFKPDAGTISLSGTPVIISSTGEAHDLGIATVFQDLALCDNLDVVSNLWLGRELNAHGVLDHVGMETRSWALLRELSVRIPSVRARVATLSGGQRQTVAIARSLIGEPSVLILDEPTAALGVAASAEVLNLIERLRERGLGVILISHNISDVQAVSDRIFVLRLGRNNGSFRTDDVTNEIVISAITGASNYTR
ncbi:MAG: sugar ABC transporter ATP-binding protein [Salinibacterium sp.]|nr:sugar ABC transporter ATP-binding protein [Salinibacterium sp.]